MSALPSNPDMVGGSNLCLLMTQSGHRWIMRFHGMRGKEATCEPSYNGHLGYETVRFLLALELD